MNGDLFSKQDYFSFWKKHPKCAKTSAYVKDRIAQNINPCFDCNLGESICETPYILRKEKEFK
jgi:hypothetical protein